MEKRTVKELLGNNKTEFLIPDYQRPYEWGEKECQTLWDDLCEFAFPENDYDKFDIDNAEYFLGPIVTFPNKNKQYEVIDGQQRLVTLMLLLRAFYSHFANKTDRLSLRVCEVIAECIWRTDEIGNLYKDSYKVETKVATDEARESFREILRTGTVTGETQNQYTDNYKFFQQLIKAAPDDYKMPCGFVPIRLLKNCVLFNVEADEQDMALKIFATLNDRGKPLSDSDIFKVQLYEYYSSIGQKDTFIERWKQLEEAWKTICGVSSMNEAFMRYMYYARAKQNNKSATTIALRKFYEQNSYELLKNSKTLVEIINLTIFWRDAIVQNETKFSKDIMKKLFVLNNVPGGNWEYIVSVYYLANRNINGMLDNNKFCKFLDKLIGFILASSIMGNTVSTQKTAIIAETIKVVKDGNVVFKKFDQATLTKAFNAYEFTNSKRLTKSMLAWWACHDDNQDILAIKQLFDIEHIYSKRRYKAQGHFSEPRNIESIGNKSLLEKNINIRASDYRFEDKLRYYKGTHIDELRNIGKTYKDFTEKEIVERKKRMCSEFIYYLKANGLI